MLLWSLLAGYPMRRVSTPRDADGNRSDLVAPYFSVRYEYNQRNQLWHIRDGNGAPFYDFGYDAGGNLTHREVRWWDGNVTNYQYDPLNRVSMAEHGTNGWIFARSWYQHDVVGREVATWREEDNGMGGSRGERYWYDVTNQLSSVRYNANEVWTGNPSDWRHSSDYNYTPDRLNRTSKVEDGNSSSYTASALNQYGSINGQGVGYDGKFNVTSYNGATFTYNAQNQLTGGSMQATYDGLGRCVRRTTSSGTRLYTYDDWNPIVEWDQWGNFAGWNMYGARADEILMRWDVTRGPMVYKQDPHGNVVALLDQWGNIVERYAYDAFGKPRVTGFWDDNDRGGSLYGNRFMFQGREWIGELGIYDYRHRMYNPELGRFLQTDPTGFGAGDMNLFRYCGDDPVDGSDPSGLLNISATIANRVAWFGGGSILTSREDDLLRQGQAEFADPTGNYKEPLEQHVARNGETGGHPGRTRYTVSDVQEVDGILVIKPTLNWWVQKNYIHTDVVKRELEHVNRWLYWQMKGAGAEMVGDFNSHPTGKQKLEGKPETARFLESRWQDENIHANGRHTLEVRPEKDMVPAALEKLIQNVGPVPFPHVLNDLGLE